MSFSRREVVRALPLAAAGGAAMAKTPALALPAPKKPAHELARDDGFWLSLRRDYYDFDPSWAYLNSALATPASLSVQQAAATYRAEGYGHPSRRLWNKLVSTDLIGIRTRLAERLGVEPDEIALTRNTTDGMAHALMGYPLTAGDEVIQTSLEFPGMTRMLARRAARDGLHVKTVDVPVPYPPAADIVARIEEAVSPKTRAILISPMPYLTGQMLPFAEISALAQARGIAVIADGAQTFGHIEGGDAKGADLFATSLHKWLGAPQGTGVFVIRRALIERTREYFPTYEFEADSVLKFEQFGTFDGASFRAVGDALDFLDSFGLTAKAARLRHLSRYWWNHLRDIDGIRPLSDIGGPGTAGIASFVIDGIRPKDLMIHLQTEHRIDTRGYESDRFTGNRIAVNVFTTKAELDRLADAVHAYAKRMR